MTSQEHKSKSTHTLFQLFKMDRWRGKVAVITGASSGIGAAVAKRLVDENIQVVGLARNVDKLKQVAGELSEKSGKFHPLKCDLLNKDDVISTFKNIHETFGPIHILINNAGIMIKGTVLDSSVDALKQIMDTNLFGTLLCTREAIAQMRETGIIGHIINVNSIQGHRIISVQPPIFNLYPVSKYGITALTEIITQELRFLESDIKITSISPGLVHNTNIFKEGNLDQFNAEITGNTPHLLPEDVANTIIIALDTPPHVQICELMVKAVGEIF